MRLDSYASTADGTVTTGWTGTRVVRSTTQKHSGTYAWQITAVTDASDKTKYAVTIPNGSSWHWSGWLYQATGTPQDVWLNTGNASGVDSVFTVTVPSAVWTYFSFDLVITDGDKVNLFIQPADTFTMGTMYFDDLSFTSWNMESSFGAYTWGASALVSGPRGEPIDETQRFSVAQMTSDGPGAVWNNCTSVNTKFRTGGTSWAITADASGMFNAWTDPLNLPETNWVYSGWLYQETGQDRDVQTVVDTADGLSWYDTFTIPSGVWTEFISSGHTDVTYVNLYASGVWSPGDDLYFDDMSFVTTSGYKDLEVTWKARSDVVPPSVISQISTSTSPLATQYTNQRKIDRTTNGVLWAIWWNGSGSTTGGLPLWYSLDDGITWNNPSTPVAFAGSGATYTPNVSFFIDIDDYAHVAYKDRHDGGVYYRRGTPNASRTSWSWSSSVLIGANTSYDYPDLVAFRNSFTGGWTVQGIYSYSVGYANSFTVQISAAGAIASPTSMSVNLNTVGNGHTYPSIDFNHIGDGKTVKDNSPHLYVAWSDAAVGSGKGIRFRKSTYSSGSWTWESEQAVDSTRMIFNSYTSSLNCMFDGNRVVIAGYLEGNTENDLVLYDTVTSKVLWENASSGTILFPSFSYDADGNIYIVAWRDGNKVSYKRWDRNNDTLGNWVDLSSTSRNGLSVSVKRGFSNNEIEFLYVDGTASPYPIKYGSFAVTNSLYATPSQKVFSYTGAQQIYTVPKEVKQVQIECWGAQGEGGGVGGGLGGYAFGMLDVTAGEDLIVTVAGGDGWPNAGNVGTPAYFLGGGSTDVRQGGNALTNQVIVAGGGGAAPSGNPSATGGAGGGLLGLAASDAGRGGKGGSQSAGGAGGVGTYNGGSGTRNSGGTVGASGAGSGGGGYFGGGAGAYQGSNFGGGGGSGYIGGVTDGVMQTGVNSGYGKVVITPMVATPNPPVQIWSGIGKLPGEVIGVWDGNILIKVKSLYQWSLYTENYEGVY